MLVKGLVTEESQEERVQGTDGPAGPAWPFHRRREVGWTPTTNTMVLRPCLSHTQKPVAEGLQIHLHMRGKTTFFFGNTFLSKFIH